jgi:hypothetical protein
MYKYMHTELTYMKTEQLADFLGAHESLKIKLGNIFRHCIFLSLFTIVLCLYVSFYSKDKLCA